jgi:hypothetical protein
MPREHQRTGCRIACDDRAVPDSPKAPAAGYLAEYEFIHVGMRQDQRERQGFLAFTLAASGLVLGLLMKANPKLPAEQACFLIGLVAGVTLVAEQLTIRASQGIGTAGAYMRIFIEPHVEGLEYQSRNPHFEMSGNVSSSRGFAWAYVAVTIAFVVAWFVAPVKEHDRECWQTLIVVVLALGSLGQIRRLLSATYDDSRGWTKIDEAWKKVLKDEEEKKKKAQEEKERKARWRPDGSSAMEAPGQAPTPAWWRRLWNSWRGRGR